MCGRVACRVVSGGLYKGDFATWSWRRVNNSCCLSHLVRMELGCVQIALVQMGQATEKIDFHMGFRGETITKSHEKGRFRPRVAHSLL